VSPQLVLAPLAGFTNAPFRLLCRRFGADLVYTEMVSAAALVHGSSPTRQLMEILPGEDSVACQIFGATPDEIAFATREATALGRFRAIDLNAGCPMTKIVQCGAGATLLRNPTHLHACLAAMKAATHLPVTVKTRPGPRPDRILMYELLDAAETAGCAGFTLHARFTSQMHGGPVHLDLLAELVRRARIPICGNGSVTDRASYKAMAATGVNAIMIGRAALAQPWIFTDLRHDTTPTDTTSLPARQNAIFREHLALLATFRDHLAEKYPHDHVPSADGFLAMALHTHLFRYFNGRPGAAELRRRLNSIRTRAEVEACAREFLL